MGRVKNFVQNFFQFTSDSRVLNDALDSLDYAAYTDDFSLQTSLNLALQDLQGQPGYASREIICVMGSLASIDPENIFSTIQVLKRHSIRCSVIGLTAEMYACKKLCDSTGGRYDVVMNDNHSREILTST
ncbi:Transcription factor ssl1 [Aphelenchoides besseyi]|nr:Transcription factor ssl1 [Aphelenchoides besseyi]